MRDVAKNIHAALSNRKTSMPDRRRTSPGDLALLSLYMAHTSENNKAIIMFYGIFEKIN
jgi:hypothetical protein